VRPDCALLANMTLSDSALVIAARSWAAGGLADGLYAVICVVAYMHVARRANRGGETGLRNWQYYFAVQGTCGFVASLGVHAWLVLERADLLVPACSTSAICIMLGILETLTSAVSNLAICVCLLNPPLTLTQYSALMLGSILLMYAYAIIGADNFVVLLNALKGLNATDMDCGNALLASMRAVVVWPSYLWVPSAVLALALRRTNVLVAMIPCAVMLYSLVGLPFSLWIITAYISAFFACVAWTLGKDRANVWPLQSEAKPMM
jgi:hypothetical protein